MLCKVYISKYNSTAMQEVYFSLAACSKLELHFLSTLAVTGPIHFFPTSTFRFQIGKGLILENWNEDDKTELCD